MEGYCPKEVPVNNANFDSDPQGIIGEVMDIICDTGYTAQPVGEFKAVCTGLNETTGFWSTSKTCKGLLITVT